MSRVCSVCNKGKMSGKMVSHSHRRTPAVWNPNVQKVTIVKENGAQEKAYVCAKCLKGGKVKRA